MSIHTNINPLGISPSAGGEEIPFIHPILDSNNSWSNEPSFGMLMEQTNLPSSTFSSVYSLFDFNYGVKFQLVSVRNYDIRFRYDFPIKIKSITLNLALGSLQGYEFSPFQLVAYDDNWNELQAYDFDFIPSSPSNVQSSTISVDNPISSKCYSIRISQSISVWYGISQIEATYQPPLVGEVTYYVRFQDQGAAPWGSANSVRDALKGIGLIQAFLKNDDITDAEWNQLNPDSFDNFYLRFNKIVTPKDMNYAIENCGDIMAASNLKVWYWFRQ